MSARSIHTFPRGQSDAIIISGAETGLPPSIERVKKIKSAVPEAPVLIGSGISHTNIGDFLEYADGCIIGTGLKKEEITINPVDIAKVQTLMNIVQNFR